MGQFEQMQLFRRVVDAGGIGKAADQLGMAKSGVSRQLLALETRLGVRLINRTTRRSSLTEAGKAYYEGALKLIDDVVELDALTSDTGSSLKGTLRLAVPLSFGLCHLSTALDEFARGHPGLTLDIDFSDRIVDLVERGIDVAIRITDLKDSSLQARRLCPIRILLCASPAYLKKHGTPTTPEVLNDHQVLGYNIGAGKGLRFTDGKSGEVIFRSPLHMVANNGDFLCEMAKAGHGIVMIPSFIAWQSLANGDLLPVLEKFTPAAISAWAVYPKTRYLSQRVRVLIDFLAKRFGDEPYWDRATGEDAVH